jgi:ABC-type nitrate/sulfonate/bicarbonate transport system substrate-binding protein
MLAALEQGRVDATPIFEPYYSSFMASGRIRAIGYPWGAIGKHFPNTLLYGTSSWVAEHPDTVRRFLRVTQEASAYVSAHESESAESVAGFAGVDPATLANIHHSGRGVAPSAAEVQLVIDTAKYKVISRSLPVGDMICTCALKR